MFIPGSLPPWTDAKGVAVAWPDGAPASDGDRGWRVSRSAATDGDGWMYGTSYERLQYDRPGGRASKRVSDSIRSRLWVRAPAGAGPGPAGGAAAVDSREVRVGAGGRGSAPWEAQHRRQHHRLALQCLALQTWPAQISAARNLVCDTWPHAARRALHARTPPRRRRAPSTTTARSRGTPSRAPRRP